MHDFYLLKYYDLINSINNNGITVYTVKNWIENEVDKGILIRHDVDRFPENVLPLAKLEHDNNIKSTYYFRINNSIFKPELIKEVYRLGHEVGYHYEDLATNNGDYKKSIISFNRNLNKIRSIVPIYTIAMHGQAFSPYNSIKLWEKYNYRDYSILGGAFITIDYTDTYYITDTGRNWHSNKYNLRDKVNSKKIKKTIENTDDLIKFINKNKYKKIALVIHPERWPSNYINFLKSAFTDFILNRIKFLLKLIR